MGIRPSLSICAASIPLSHALAMHCAMRAGRSSVISSTFRSATPKYSKSWAKDAYMEVDFLSSRIIGRGREADDVLDRHGDWPAVAAQDAGPYRPIVIL